ncbi:MAG: hypothetical protein WD078_08805 [Woeseia sp.]
MNDSDDDRDTVHMMVMGGISPERIALALNLNEIEVHRLLRPRAADDTSRPPAARRCRTPGCRRLTLRPLCDECASDDGDLPPRAA